MKNSILIFPADDSDPQQGFYEAVLKRGCRPRALGVMNHQGIWSVFLDGNHYGSSTDWKEAFGKLYNQAFLQGKKLTSDEYRNLIMARAQDIKAGITLDNPVNHLQSEIAI